MRSGLLMRSTCLLVCADELCLFEHVPLHSIQQMNLGRMAEIGQHDVERAELEEIPVLSDGWAWTTIPDPLPVIETVFRAARQLLLGGIFR